MPIVQNVTTEEVSVRIVGNWFSFKPGQKKVLTNDLAKFIELDRKDSGLIVLPPEFEEDADFKDTIEGKEIIQKLTDAAIDQYLEKYRSVIYNNQVSLRQDLEQKNIKADPAAFATPGEIKAMEIVAKYQDKQADATAKKIKQVNELVAKTKKA